MKNNQLMLCLAAAGAVLLAGCSAYNRAESSFTEPVVKSVKTGQTKQQVVQIAGAPASEVRLKNARGVCSNYLLKNRDGTAQNYFVSFDETGHVLNKGFQSCEAYDTNPQR